MLYCLLFRQYYVLCGTAGCKHATNLFRTSLFRLDLQMCRSHMLSSRHTAVTYRAFESVSACCKRATKLDGDQILC